MAKAKTETIASEYEYGTTKIRDKDGRLRTSRGNDDAVARAMLVFTAADGDIDQVIRQNKLEDKMKPHAKKAPGLKRMTLGVMLRALVRNGTPVKIGKNVVEKLNQKIELPQVEKAADKRQNPSAKKAHRAARKRAAKKEQAAAAA